MRGNTVAVTFVSALGCSLLLWAMGAIVVPALIVLSLLHYLGVI